MFIFIGKPHCYNDTFKDVHIKMLLAKNIQPVDKWFINWHYLSFIVWNSRSKSLIVLRVA